ncbi:hypothetical protein LZ32DRAFT_34436 [Colletotrichum eremochloae]|nr:hypothetical protein LZ32DRAFT_34436 [Colletotrichum eremochloae]
MIRIFASQDASTWGYSVSWIDRATVLTGPSTQQAEAGTCRDPRANGLDRSHLSGPGARDSAASDKQI